jgi:hypothetical protein
MSPPDTLPENNLKYEATYIPQITNCITTRNATAAGEDAKNGYAAYKTPLNNTTEAHTTTITFIILIIMDGNVVMAERTSCINPPLELIDVTLASNMMLPAESQVYAVPHNIF